MSFRILIVEDEALYADQLEMLVEKLGHRHLGTLDNSAEALAVITKTPPDLILMDVHIEGEHDGIELAELIQRKHTIPIIFVTSLQDDLTFRRASRTGPANFLLKPFGQLQLQRAIELAFRQTTERTSTASPTNSAPAAAPAIEPSDGTAAERFNDHFFVKDRGQLHKVTLADVLYLEADGHYCRIHTAERKHLVHQSLTEFSDRLPDHFVTTHRSFLVNLRRVTGIDTQENTIRLGEREVPLSRRNKEEVLRRLDWV